MGFQGCVHSIVATNRDHSLVGNVVVIGLDTYKLSVTYNTLHTAGCWTLVETSKFYLHSSVLTLNTTIYMQHRNTYEKQVYKMQYILERALICRVAYIQMERTFMCVCVYNLLGMQTHIGRICL